MYFSSPLLNEAFAGDSSIPRAGRGKIVRAVAVDARSEHETAGKE
jgi:hypothetical protein